MRLLLLTHYYAPEFGAPQRRWSALIGRFIAAGHRVTVAAPVPHYPAGRPTRTQRRSHRVGAVERGRHGETVLRTAYLPHRADITSRTADHLIAAADAMRRLRRRFSRPGTRPDVIVATAPAIPTLMVGRALSLLWDVPLVVEMRDAWPDLVTHVGPVGALGPEALLAARRSAGRRLLTWTVALVKGRVHREVTSWQSGARAVVTTTARFAEVLRERGVDPVRVVRNGTDLSLVPRQRDHLPGDHPELRCLYLGNMGRSQGLDAVVRVVAALDGVRLRIVGAGAQWDELRAAAAETTDQIEFYPQMSGEDLEAQWAWAHTGLVSLAENPSFERTIPSKLVSIMARGTHVTGVVAGEAAQVIHDSAAGRVVSPGDEDELKGALSELRDDPHTTEVGERPRQWVREHASPEAAAQTYLQLLQDVIR